MIRRSYVSAVKTLAVATSMAAMALAGLGQTTTPPAAATAAVTTPPAGTSAGMPYRVSAMIRTSNGVKVGLIDSRNTNSFFLGRGDSRGDVTVLDADYETEKVLLQIKGQQFPVVLSGDPNAPKTVIPAAATNAATVYRGEGIESFLKEHPEAEIKSFQTPFQFPTNEPPVEGLGEGIESYLKDHPELREKTMKPAVGLGEGIEATAGNDPELIKKLQQPAVGLGEGIENALKEHPEWASQTNMMFPNLPPGVTMPPPEVTGSSNAPGVIPPPPMMMQGMPQPPAIPSQQ